MESYVRIGGRDLKNLTCTYMGVGVGVKNCQNHGTLYSKINLSYEAEWEIIPCTNQYPQICLISTDGI